MKILYYILILLFIFCSAATADVLPEGKKKISFYFSISGLDKYPEYVFLAYPVNQSGGKPNNECIVLEEGKPVYLSCKFSSPAIYAIKKENFNPEDIVIGKNEEIQNPRLDSFFANNKNISGTKEIACDSYVEQNAKYEMVTVYYSVKSLNADALIIKIIKTVRALKDGQVIDEINGDGEGRIIDGRENNYVYFSLPFLSLIALVTFVIVRKKKK